MFITQIERESLNLGAICDDLDTQQLDAEGMDAFESFTSRFARVSDILFNKVFRSIFYLEQGENASWLDVTLFMEKKAIIDDLNQARIIKPKLSDLNPEESGKNRFTYPPQADDLEIVAFHRMGEVKSLQFLYPRCFGAGHERESLNLGTK